MHEIKDIEKQIWRSERDFLMKQIALLLVKNKAIKFGDFTWTSGLKRPYYIDLRLTISDTVTLDWITNAMARCIVNEIGKDKIDKIVGVPTAGVPFATLVSQKLGIPMIYARKEAKAHGRKRRIEGLLERGERVLIIDDLISTGKSNNEVTEIIREEGGVVNDVVVVLDHEIGGKENIRAIGVEPHVLFNITDAFKWLYSVNLVDKKSYDMLLDGAKKENIKPSNPVSVEVSK